ncbi:MAG: CBS domain-containing protein [Mucilaginibacter sp.]
MYAIELISDAIAPVHTSDTIQRVLERMAEFRISHLPIVNEEQFLGLLSEDDFANVTDNQVEVGALGLSLVNPYVLTDQHIYDVIRLFCEQKLSVVPVLDHKKNYLGLITINAMNEYFARITAADQAGGIIVLEINNKNNSLAHMAQIVESDNAQILSSYVYAYPDSTRMEVTLKVNKQDISAIVATFLRYDYDVKATFHNVGDNDGSKDRYDSLMNYLNL